MTQKIKLNPDICYLLGAHSCSKCSDNSSVEMSSKDESSLERFIKIAIGLGIEPNKLLVSKSQRPTLYTVKFYNSKMRKFIDTSMERSEHIFRYANIYTANYFAGMFDACGGADERGIYLYGPGKRNIMLIEKFGFHTSHTTKVRIRKAESFITFIRKHSLRMQNIVHLPGNERDLC